MTYHFSSGGAKHIVLLLLTFDQRNRQLRDVAGDEERESLYEIVEDEQEQEGLLAVFEQLLDDVDIER